MIVAPALPATLPAPAVFSAEPPAPAVAALPGAPPAFTPALPARDSAPLAPAPGTATPPAPAELESLPPTLDGPPALGPAPAVLC